MENYDDARRFGLETLEASKELRERRTEANVLCSLGLVELVEDRFQKAFDYFQSSLKVHIKIGNKTGEAAVLWNIGLTCADLYRFEEAVEYGGQSVDLYREVGNKRSLSIKLGILAMRLIELGRVEDTLSCIEECEDLANELDIPEARLWATIAWAGLAFKNGNLEKALDYYHRIHEEVVEIEDQGMIAHALSEIGLIKLEQGKREEAREYLQRAIDASNERDENEISLAIAELYFMTDKSDAAINYARMARVRAEALGDSKALDRAEEILKELDSHTTTNQQN